MVVGYLIVSALAGIIGAIFALWSGASFLLSVAVFYGCAIPVLAVMVALVMSARRSDFADDMVLVAAQD